VLLETIQGVGIARLAREAIEDTVTGTPFLIACSALCGAL